MIGFHRFSQPAGFHSFSIPSHLFCKAFQVLSKFFIVFRSFSWARRAGGSVVRPRAVLGRPRGPNNYNKELRKGVLHGFGWGVGGAGFEFY